jgi:asparagine synthase (glutamine-hydrolysing)
MIRLQNNRILHRGPDGTGIHQTQSATLGHTRLAINGVENGAQPLVTDETSLTINGEIYNYQELVDEDDLLDLRTDCDVILKLWNKLQTSRYEKYTYEKCDESSLICDDYYGSGKYHYPMTGDEKKIETMLNSLQGDFAFVLVDEQRHYHLVARDPIGVVPLYYGYNDGDKELGFASEMKCLSTYKHIKVFPPGAYYDGQLTKDGSLFLKWWYKPTWRLYPSLHNYDLESLLGQLRDKLTDATRRRLMSDVPRGVLLSGGLDSSIIASIAARESDGAPIETFSIGMSSFSPDLEKAEMVARHLKSNHHSVTFTEQEGLEALKDVIRHIETYDVTSIRASTPMFLLAEYISSKGIKTVLSGEGADEIFGGYLYFHNAPSPTEFRHESIRRVGQLHLFDCLRANKSCMAHGVETRVPFLDTDFLDVAMKIHPDMCLNDDIEKWVLRKAFEDYLPNDIVWRQKEQFSDGVGSTWIDALQAEASRIVSDDELASANRMYPHNTPTTKEAYMYRQIF